MPAWTVHPRWGGENTGPSGSLWHWAVVSNICCGMEEKDWIAHVLWTQQLWRDEGTEVWDEVGGFATQCQSDVQALQGYCQEPCLDPWPCRSSDLCCYQSVIPDTTEGQGPCHSLATTLRRTGPAPYCLQHSRKWVLHLHRTAQYSWPGWHGWTGPEDMRVGELVTPLFVYHVVSREREKCSPITPHYQWQAG